MFTPTDLDHLIADTSSVTVTFTLPTETCGAETREASIRLKNLVAQATVSLVEQGFSPSDADAFVRPAQVLIDDSEFWQHQDHGLAVFLGEDDPRVYSVPLPLGERVDVSRRFRVRSLLPLLSEDGPFHVLALTQGQAQLFRASRHTMTEIDRPSLPAGMSSLVGRSDDEDAESTPAARPHIGSVSAVSPQVRGDSPAEWRKRKLLAYARKFAVDLDDLSTTDAAPVVLIANRELAGHVQKLSNAGTSFAAVVDVNPAALSTDELHRRAYGAVVALLDQPRQAALREFRTLQGQHSPRAVDDPFEIMHLAQEGRVDTLLLEHPGPFPHDAEPMNHLLEAAITSTLSHRGFVHLVSLSDLPRTSTAAVLRY